MNANPVPHSLLRAACYALFTATLARRAAPQRSLAPLCLCGLLALSLSHLRATEWYVAPTNASPAGASGNAGTQASPWDLQTALTGKTGTIVAGDTVWMMPGTYKKADGSGYSSTLAGNATAPITLRQHPSGRAIIETTNTTSGNAASFQIKGNYARYWGFEYTNTGAGRKYMEGSPNQDVPRAPTSDAFLIGSGASAVNHVELINLTVYNATGSAFVAFDEATDVKIYGCVAFNNGISKFEHGIYSNSPGGTSWGKQYTNNVLFNNSSLGITLHSTSGDLPIRNYDVQGNTLFGNGVAYNTSSVRNFDLKGTSVIDVQVKNNYMQQSNSIYKDAILDWDLLADNDPEQSNDVAYQNNYHTAELAKQATPGTNISTTPNVEYNGGTGYSNTEILVRANDYEPGRANVTIYNWANATQVTLTPTHLGSTGAKLTVNQAYEVRDAQNFFGTALLTFTYDGTTSQTITLPDTGATIPQYTFGVLRNSAGTVVDTNYRPGVNDTLSHTSRKFACLIILPTGQPTPSPLVAEKDPTNPTSQINLAWQNVANETGYEIERKTTGAFALLTSKGANATGHSDTGLSPATTYTYRVRALYTSGSALSNEASATTDGSGGGDTTPPTVSVTAPSDGATISGSSVTVSANASDDVGVVGVQFLVDGSNLNAEVTTAPFTTTWNTTTFSNGTHTVTAVARDAAGHSTTSSAVTVTVSNSTGVPFVYDANDLTISASSGDSTDTVSNTGANGGDFLRYNSNAANDYATFTVNVAVAGTYNVSVRYRINQLFGICQLLIDNVNQGTAQDLYTGAGASFSTRDLGSVSLAAGNRAFKFKITGKNASAGDYQFGIDTITLTPPSGGDTTAPTVSITAPTNGSTVSATVSVSANASDNVGVAGVQFKLDGANLGSEVTAAPFTISWDTTTASAGSHSLTAVARDAAGNSTTSSAVSVTVSNGAAIAFRAATSANSGSGTANSVVVNKPAGVVSGDVMLAGISVNATSVTITPPAGWTHVRTMTDSFKMAIYRKTAGSSEPASYTWTFNEIRKFAVGIVAFSGVNGAAPIQVENGAIQGTTAATAHATPTITTSGSTTWLVSIFGDRNGTGSTWTAPSGATERVDTHATGATAMSLAIYTEGPVSAGSKTHTATASVSSAEACMEIIAITP